LDERGLYFHAECRGCVSFGTECEESCEYSESPNQCPFFKSIEEDEQPGIPSQADDPYQVVQMNPNKFVVTRQCYWPDGGNIVEIAQGGRDYCNPNALVARYPGEFGEFTSLVEAVETAISIAETWKWDTSDPILIALGCTGGMTIPFESRPADEEVYADLREKAKKFDEGRPCCPVCGDLLEEETFSHAFSDGERFCSETCAGKDYHNIVGDSEEDEEDSDPEEDEENSDD